jgi:hypothetical protein
VANTPLHQSIQSLTDIKAATVLVTAGATGSFAQAVTEWANIFVACGNAVLVLGGLYLMYCKIFKKKDSTNG